ncbi:MAG: hypothetical protein WC960_07755 [Bacteroidales bacterium]
MFLKEFFRKRALSKLDQRRDREYLPLNKIKSAIVLYNPSQPNSKEIPAHLSTLYGNYNIRYKLLAICHLDRKKIVTPPPAVIPLLDKSRCYYGGVPKAQEIDTLLEERFDLLIDMSQKYLYTNHYMAKALDASFKVGRIRYHNTPFDLVLFDRESSHEGFLKALLHYLSTINSI